MKTLIFFFLIAGTAQAADISRRGFMQGAAAAAATLKLNPVGTVAIAEPQIDLLLLQEADFYQRRILNFDRLVVEHLLGPRPMDFAESFKMGGEIIYKPLIVARPTASQLWSAEAKTLTWDSQRFQDGRYDLAVKLAQAARNTGERLGISKQAVYEEVVVSLKEMITPYFKPWARQHAPMGQAFEKVYFEELKAASPTFAAKARDMLNLLRRLDEMYFAKPLKGMPEGKYLRDLSERERKRILELNSGELAPPRSAVNAFDEIYNPREDMKALNEEMKKIAAQRQRLLKAPEPLTDAHQRIIKALRQRACDGILSADNGVSTSESTSGNERVLEQEYPLPDASSDPLHIPNNSR